MRREEVDCRCCGDWNEADSLEDDSVLVQFPLVLRGGLRRLKEVHCLADHRVGPNPAGTFPDHGNGDDLLVVSDVRERVIAYLEPDRIKLGFNRVHFVVASVITDHLRRFAHSVEDLTGVTGQLRLDPDSLN